MRIFAISDLHVDYQVNANWVSNLSKTDYLNDILILAGDISNTLKQTEACFNMLALRFKQVLYVPGNHDLWVARDKTGQSSFQKFESVRQTALNAGVSVEPFFADKIAIVPLLGWYDFSFGEPGAKLKMAWSDFHACAWPAGMDQREITQAFTDMNEPLAHPDAETVITFSHFLPRIDIMPQQIPVRHRFVYPVLGTTALEKQLRDVGSSVHIYGHSHVNRHVSVDGVTYINNAFGYPAETRISAKKLICIYDEGRILEKHEQG